MPFIDYPSPNFDERMGVLKPDMLVLHYTGMISAQAALERLTDPASGVSAHYMVDEDGTVYSLVHPDKRAWHAGVSYWAGREGINHYSIGIEIVNPGHEWGYRAFPQVQMDAVLLLCQRLVRDYAIPASYVVAHSDIAPDRKEDPGELFNWQWLAEHGVGLWPSGIEDAVISLLGGSGLAVDVRGDVIESAQKALADFGYKIMVNGIMDAQTCAVLKAFARRFLPERVNSRIAGG